MYMLGKRSIFYKGRGEGVPDQEGPLISFPLKEQSSPKLRLQDIVVVLLSVLGTARKFCSDVLTVSWDCLGHVGIFHSISRCCSAFSVFREGSGCAFGGDLPVPSGLWGLGPKARSRCLFHLWRLSYIWSHETGPCISFSFCVHN